MSDKTLNSEYFPGFERLGRDYFSDYFVITALAVEPTALALEPHYMYQQHHRTMREPQQSVHGQAREILVTFHPNQTSSFKVNLAFARKVHVMPPTPYEAPSPQLSS